MTGAPAWTDRLSTRERIEGRVARLLAGLPGHWLLRVIRERPRVVGGCTLDPHVQFILAARRSRPTLALCEPTIEQGRRRYRREVQAVTQQTGTRPSRVKTVTNIVVDGAAGALPARHYVPQQDPGDRPAPLVVYFHGGGFTLGDLDTHDEPCRLLCQHAGMHVVSVAYRLAPEHPFPAATDDACAALRWAQQNAATLGADPTRVCIGGDSAGGNLAVTASLASSREGQPPVALLMVYPTTDFASRLPSRVTFGEGYLLTAKDMDAFTSYYLGNDGTTHRSDPRASPAFAPDLHLLPPTLLVTAAFDPLRDEGEAFAGTLKLAGVNVRTMRIAGLPHGYAHMTTIVPNAMAAVADTARKFRTLVDDAATRTPARSSAR